MPRPNKGMRVRGVRFTDAEWSELGRMASAVGVSRGEMIRTRTIGVPRWNPAPPPFLIKGDASLSPDEFAIESGGKRTLFNADGTKKAGCVYCHRFTDMQDSLPVKGGGSAHASCAMRASMERGFADLAVSIVRGGGAK